MGFKSVTILALVVFLVSLFAAAAFAGSNCVTTVSGCACSVTRAQQGTTGVPKDVPCYVTCDTKNRYVLINGRRFRVKCISNPIQGALHAFTSLFESEEYKAYSITLNCSCRNCPGYCP